ncbi:hypothetical protein [Oceanobacillus manasiensis]|uniref:hypothetical protein n=1 Tax=Oceanobacillus manasiensis TaxID=586413 RepID=UPI0009FE0710|nr:hypothetical protein [Oceanobacillus manasiensis]
MTFHYLFLDSIPEESVLNGVLEVHRTIFGQSDDLLNKMTEKPPLGFVIAMKDKRVIGYKIG